MKNKLVLLIGIIVIVCVGIGGKIYMDSKKLEEMVMVVKSEEAKNVFETGLRNLDQKALTPEGVIQSYEIDYDSIEKNPMGGINVTLLANKKNDLYVFFTLNKNSENILVDDGGGNSSELEKLLEEKN